MPHLASKLANETASLFAQARARKPFAKYNWFCDSPRSVPVVVSVTTFPKRVGSLRITLRTILRQTVKPDKIVITLSAEEFPDKQPPAPLVDYATRGVEFIFADGNTKSYKKLLPALSRYPDAIIVTADDDVLYPRTWLKSLLDAHRGHPEAVIGHRGTRILGSKNDLAPYVEWPQADIYTPASRIFLTGMGGILYPPRTLPDDVHDLTLASSLCPTADDIWFKAMTLLHNTPAQKVSNGLGSFPTLRRAQRNSLRSINVEQGRNELQFRNVMNHFDLWDRLC
ncbi:hypothetical protein [Rhodococcus sp. A14]|uniref:hypothetical protein n=1 Tax=Rhodococcus sp. A14 TaxID=1194106 RepID=UPI001423DA29|nr:hypothetical protein [Rhodococcus sp. A14]